MGAPPIITFTGNPAARMAVTVLRIAGIVVVSSADNPTICG
jgi:hypothetical protein